MLEIREVLEFYDILRYDAANFGKYFSLKKAYPHDAE
jgi:hypothetical protein